MATRGIMAENMFIGQSTLLQWLNSTLSLRLEKIEETCSGAVACQLMDCLHPGSVNMKRVDFNVRNDWEYVNNYKELQQCFTKVAVDRAFNVSQLSKGKRQDSIEFMQWFKGYWDHTTGGQDVAADYDAVGRRALCKNGDWKKFSVGEGGVRPSATSDGTIPAVRRGGAAPTSAPMRVPVASNKAAVKSALRGTPTPAAAAEATAKMNDLMEQVTELKLKVETAEKERDFYFDKLRDIEILCQAPELSHVPVLKTVEKVLYAADSEEAKNAMAEAQEEYGAQLLCPAEGDAAPVEGQGVAAAVEAQ